MIEVLVSLVWACLLVPAYKHPIFMQVFSDRDVLAEFMTAACLGFCPGLLEVIRASSPPALSFFRSLPSKPSDTHRRWAVYALVLEKPGAIPLIYIGSGTSHDKGIRARFTKYNIFDHTVPYHVRLAVEKGYAIVHKGLLVWCPLPSAADVPRFRVLFVAIEAALTFLFWAMKSNNKDYGYGSCCPWDRNARSYNGLCGHSALNEGAIGDFDLSAEQLEALATERRANVKAYNADYYQASLQKDPEGFKAKNIAKAKKYAKENPEKVAAGKKRQDAKVIASKKYHCVVCDKSFSCPSHLKTHNKGGPHLLKVAAAAKSAST